LIVSILKMWMSDLPRKYSKSCKNQTNGIERGFN
jgi:hypothetical protein